jgi:UDP-N-acetyl-D-galactosamine dehydrogenase
VKLLIQKNKVIKGAKVLILGITFKENCPDLRNSKVIDVINALKEFGIIVDCYDPHATPEAVEEEYNISLLSNLKKQCYQGIVHAVSHLEFTSIDFKSLLDGEGIIYDVKSVLPKSLVDSRL